MAKLTKTTTPGIFRRHVKGCPNQGVVSPKKRCDCNYAVPKRDRDGKQFIETFQKFEAARAAKGKRDAGDKTQKSKVTFGEYFEGKGVDDSEGWIGTYAGRTKRGFEEETRTEYRRSIKVEVMPRWGHLLISEIGTRQVRELYAAMVKAGKSHAAIKKVRAALSPLFNTAIEDEEITVNPVTGVTVPAPPKADDVEEDEERGKALRRDELAAFLGEVRADWRFFFEFLVVTGLRIGEAVGLTWENVVDLTGDEPRIRVREQIYEGRRKRYLKSDAGKRDLPLSPTMAKRLLEYRRDHYQGPKAPVFATRTGEPYRPSNIYRRILAPAAIEASLYVEVPGAADQVDELTTVVVGRSKLGHYLDPDAAGQTLCGRDATDPDDVAAKSACRICTDAAARRARAGRKTSIAFHAFRHTCASLLFADGRNVKQVSEWLGHTDPGFTLRVYIHLLDDGLGAGIDVPVPTPDDASGLHDVDLGVDPAEKRPAR